MADDTPDRTLSASPERGGTIEPATKRFLDHMGPEAADRAPPRLARAVGAFAALMGGLAVAALGVEVVDGGAPRALGALIALVYGGGGLALVVLGRPSQRTAGVVGVTVAVPAAYGFLIFSRDFDRTDPTIVLALATVTWGVLHVLGPTRGHPTLLAAALTGAWAAVVVQVGVDGVSAVFDSPFGEPGRDTFLDPDTSGAAVSSLVFGTGYLAAGYGLDRAGLRGTATVFVGVALAALALGVFVATTGREEWLVGLVLVSAGILVGFVGAHLGRRLSTWLGAGVVVAGVAALVDAAVPDEHVVTGALVALGAAALIVVAAPSLAAGMGEGDDGEAPDA